MADWSHLPKELLQLISEKLNSEIYLIRFRSVCSTWRFSIPKPHNHFPLNLPHFSDSNHSDIHKLFKHTIFLIKPPTTPNQQTLRPWLVRVTPTSTGKFNLCHPILGHSLLPSDPCVIDFNQLSVFRIGQTYICGMLHPNSSTTKYHHYDWSVATFQGEQILDIVTREYPQKLAMLRRGCDSWTNIPNGAIFYHDICIFKGRPCVTDETGRTVMIGSDLSVHLVADPVCDGYLDGKVYIILENESELLLVYKYNDFYADYIDGVYDFQLKVRIDVFRLDQKDKKWLELENLGDTVLFLGQYDSFTASALDLGFDKGNFVIYRNDDYDDVKSEMSIFHLDTRWNFPLSDYPDYLKLFSPPPEWIASRCL